MTSIENSVFSNCDRLSTVNCYITTPLNIVGKHCFEDINTSKCALNVPAGTEVTYQAAAVWKDFSPISGNYFVEVITNQGKATKTIIIQ
ncbi:hypothetical protein [Flavobacterium psychrophilum]|uniref:hypothetical protein n=2 Tax=Flavobacterium psychrophilum TaxID=96345 RepID=UPI0006935311